jgi:transcriptional repressor NrdR
MGAKCPKCHSMLSRVVKSAGNLGYVRRRRECVHCGERFTTYED